MLPGKHGIVDRWINRDFEMRIVIAACLLLISVIKVAHADTIRIAAADDPIARVVARIATEVYRQVSIAD